MTQRNDQKGAEPYSGLPTGVGERFKRRAPHGAPSAPPPPAPAPPPAAEVIEEPTAEPAEHAEPDFGTPSLPAQTHAPEAMLRSLPTDIPESREARIAAVLEAATEARERIGTSVRTRRVPVTVYMDDATYKRLVQYQRTRREDLGSRDYDNGRVLLDAFRAVFEEVPGAVLDSLAPRTIGLFEDYPDTRGAAKAPANIPWQCQFAQSNLAVTDAMARALAAVGGTEVSRSSVLLTALDLFLPPLAPKRFAGDRSRKRGGSSAKQAATD